MNPLAHKTKIVATIGPASQTPEIIGEMIRAGMNIARLNFSHGEFAAHRQNIENIRAASNRWDAGRHHGRFVRPEDAHRANCGGTDSTEAR